MERPQKRLERLAGFVRHKSGLMVPAEEAARADKAEEQRRALTVTRVGPSQETYWTRKVNRKRARVHAMQGRKENKRRLIRNKRRSWRNAK